MKNQILLLGMLFAILLAACTKTNNQPALPYNGPAGTIRAVASAAINDTPENPANLVDQTGAIHNQLMDQVRAYHQKTGDTTRAGTDRLIASSMQEQWHTDISKALEIMKGYAAPTLSDGRMVITYPKVSDTAIRPFGDQIMALLADLSKTGNYATFKQQMIALEAAIQKENRLGKRSQQNLLTVASIARYSSWYWMEVYGLHNGGQQHTEGFFKKLYRALATAAADAFGAYFTALTERDCEFSEVLGGGVDASSNMYDRF